MAAFALLSEPGALDDLSETLKFEPERLIGLWIEGDPASGTTPAGTTGRTLARLAAVPSLELRPICQQDRFAVCRIGATHRVTLLDLLMYLSHGGLVAASGRFVPVFRADTPVAARRAAWLSLAQRYPGAVLPPMVQDKVGDLHCDDFEGFDASVPASPTRPF